jgi:membrane protein
VLALFPAVLVLVSILGLLGKSTTRQVLNNLGQVAPGGVHTFLTNVVTQVQGPARPQRAAPQRPGGASRPESRP